MKYSYKTIMLVLIISCALSCGGDSKPATPSDTLKAYSIAVKKKDVKMIKLLLSDASLKIHQDQAKAQNVALEEIILRETIFSVDQRVKHKRNEKIEGDKATIEVKNDFDGWDMIHFVKENGLWKIDKKGFSDQIINQNEEDERKLDEQFEKERQKTEDAQKNIDPESTTDSDTIPDLNNPSETPNDSPEETNDPSKKTN